MKHPRILTVLLIALTAIGCTSLAQKKTPATKPAEKPISAEERKLNIASFDEVWTTIRDKHFDPKLNGVDWNAARDELRPKVENAKTDSEARAAMGELLHRLNQSHFAIIPRSVYDDVDEGKDSDESEDGGGVSGIEVRIVDGHALVTRVAPDSAADKAGVKTGWELVAVRGKPVATVISKLAEAVKSESLRPAMQALTIQRSLHGAIGKATTMTFINGHGKKLDVQVVMQPTPGRLVQFGNLPVLPLEFECRRVDGNISMFRLNIFLDPPTVMPAFRQCVQHAITDHADGFIIDLRGNPGGIGVMAIGIGNCFVSKPNQYLGQMIGRDGPGIKFELNRQPVHYDGPLAVLIDSCSISTSEILAGGLRDIGRARIFGTRSAGAALPSVIVELPNHDRFQYAVSNYISSGGKALEGEGVVPDEVIAPTRASLLAGNDAVLDAAVKWCKAQSGNH